jgi:hypothetical protein
MFGKMLHDAWQAALRPKIQGSWNLHEILPAELGFFIMLSSLNGVMGVNSQANYATGGTLQDAPAQYLVSIGLPATSLDLGAVNSIGFVAEGSEYARHTTAGLEQLQENEIHYLLDYILHMQARGSSGIAEQACQFTAGFSSEAMYLDEGVPVPAFLQFPLFTHLRLPTTAQNNRVFDVRKLIQASKSLE